MSEREVTMEKERFFEFSIRVVLGGEMALDGEEEAARYLASILRAEPDVEEVFVSTGRGVRRA